MVNKRFRNCIKKVRTAPGADIDSDHNPVLMDICISLKKLSKPEMREHLNLNLLKEINMREKYNVEVKNRYESLQIEENDQTPEVDLVNKKWESFKESIQKGVE